MNAVNSEANTYDTDGWSPRYHQLLQLDEQWGICDVNATLESILGSLDLLEEIIDDYKEHKRSQQPPAPKMVVRGDAF